MPFSLLSNANKRCFQVEIQVEIHLEPVSRPFRKRQIIFSSKKLRLKQPLDTYILHSTTEYGTSSSLSPTH